MKSNLSEFVNSIDSENTKKVVKFVFKDIDEKNIETYNAVQMEQLILDKNPSSYKEIITIVYILSLYFKFLHENGIVDNDNACQIVQSLDKKLLWNKSKPNAKKKFISNEQFDRVIHEIGVYEEFNSLYYESLFSCIYHGIYNDDLSVIKNLRGKDVSDNGIVVLHEDNGHVYKIKIPEELAKNLKKLSEIDIWERKNRFGICKVEMRGIHADSVFKIENRSTASNDSYKFTFYAKLRKITKEYLEYSLLPLQLYTSGIMHRIKMELDKNDITLEEAFADNSRNKIAHLIVSKELMRCNSNIEVGNFRELVKGHLDSF